MVIKARVPGAKIDDDDVALCQWPYLRKYIVPECSIEAPEAARKNLTAILQLHLSQNTRCCGS